MRNGKIQVQLPKPSKGSTKKVEKEVKKEAPKKEEPKKEQPKEKKAKSNKQPKAPPKAPGDDRPVDVSRLAMKVGKIIECVKHPGKIDKI